MEITHPGTCIAHLGSPVGAIMPLYILLFPWQTGQQAEENNLKKMALYIYISPKQDTLMKSSKFFFDPMLFPNEILTLPEAP